MSKLNELSTNLHLLNEMVLPEYNRKTSDTGFAVMGIARMLRESELNERELSDGDKLGFLKALERLGDSLVDLSDDVENQRFEIHEDIKQQLNQLQQGGFRHA